MPALCPSPGQALRVCSELPKQGCSSSWRWPGSRAQEHPTKLLSWKGGVENTPSSTEQRGLTPGLQPRLKGHPLPWQEAHGFLQCSSQPSYVLQMPITLLKSPCLEQGLNVLQLLLPALLKNEEAAVQTRWLKRDSTSLIPVLLKATEMGRSQQGLCQDGGLNSCPGSKGRPGWAMEGLGDSGGHIP